MSLLSPTTPGRVLFSEKQIQQRVCQLGRELSEYYQGQVPCFIGLMNGALFFLTDLLREMEQEVEIHCVRLSSYSGSISLGMIRGLEEIDVLADQVRGRSVLVVDDVLDTGLTLATSLQRLRDLGAREVKSCILLDKQYPREINFQPDWVGFKIANEFVVGYGLDFNGRYRGLPDIQILTVNSPLKA